MKWSDEEKEYLIKNYINTPKEEILYNLEGRTWEGVRSYASKVLGLCREKETLIRDNGKSRQCKRCGNIYPQTEEHFYRDKKGFRVYCKECWLAVEEEKRKLQGALTRQEKDLNFADGKKYCGKCNQWKSIDDFNVTKQKKEMGWNDYHHWCRGCEKLYNSAWGILSNSSILKHNGWNIEKIIKVIKYIRTGNEKNLESMNEYSDLRETISIVHNLIQNGSNGTVIISSRGDICKSQVELEIVEFFIANKIKYIKDAPYKEFWAEDKRTFDFKIEYNDKIYYMEYFGLYDGKKRKGYTKGANKKMNDLEKQGIMAQCIFIFPTDLRDNTIFSILEDRLEIKGAKYPKKVPTQLSYMTDEELLKMIMKYSNKNGYLPTIREMRNHHSTLYNEVEKRYKSYTKFGDAMGVKLQHLQFDSITLEQTVEIIDYMIQEYGAFWGENNIRKSKDERLKPLTLAYQKFTVEKVKEYYLDYCNRIGSLIYAQGNYVTLETAMPVIKYMLEKYGEWLSFYKIKKSNDKNLNCLKYAYRRFGEKILKEEYLEYDKLERLIS